jgi:molybdenum cofactor cytidylyltransferase
MIGILLAAGFSRRFGAEDKLLQRLPDGHIIAEAAAQTLITALPISVAAVRAENIQLGQALEQLGFRVVYCQAQAKEMADSLVSAVKMASGLQKNNKGYVIALADMPYISVVTIRAVAEQISAGTDIVQPTYQGKRGHPVGFSSKYQDDLLRLKGDEGARSIIKQHAEKVMLLPSDDAGILADIDTPADLLQAARLEQINT